MPNHYVLFAVKGQISVFCLSHWNRYVSISNLHESVISSSKLPSSKTFLIYSSQLGMEGFRSSNITLSHFHCCPAIVVAMETVVHVAINRFCCFCCRVLDFLCSFFIVVVIRWHYTCTYLMVLPFFESDMFAKEIR